MNSTESDLDKVLNSQRNKIRRVGLVCEDRNIIAAMDPKIDGHYTPVAIKKDGEYKNNSDKFVEPSFENLFAKVDAKIIEVAIKMKSGDASAEPLKTDNHDSCEYCAMSAVCRRKAYCEEHSTVLHAIPSDESNYEGGED
jgi:ATP-dependent helicase/DNAse subunit B